jgi:hypothetical protein
MRPAHSFKKSEKIVQPPGTKLEGVALSWRPAIPIPPSPPCLAGHPLGVVEFSATPIFFAPVERNSPRSCLFETKLAPTSISIEDAPFPGVTRLYDGRQRTTACVLVRAGWARFVRTRARLVCVGRAAWHCARRRALGWQSPTPWRVGTAWRSGTQAQAVHR